MSPLPKIMKYKRTQALILLSEQQTTKTKIEDKSKTPDIMKISQAL